MVGATIERRGASRLGGFNEIGWGSLTGVGDGDKEGESTVPEDRVPLDGDSNANFLLTGGLPSGLGGLSGGSLRGESIFPDLLDPSLRLGVEGTGDGGKTVLWGGGLPLRTTTFTFGWQSSGCIQRHFFVFHFCGTQPVQEQLG